MKNSKQMFNTYIDGIDVSFLRELCERGEPMYYNKGDVFCQIGEQSDVVGFVEKGAFKYEVVSTVGKRYITGFAFENTFVADFPNCIYRHPSEVQITAISKAKVFVVPAEQVYSILKETPYMEQVVCALFANVYKNLLDFYRYSPKERYIKLLRICPQLVQDVSLQEIASYLKITPTYLSKIRKEITYDNNCFSK